MLAAPYGFTVVIRAGFMGGQPRLQTGGLHKRGSHNRLQKKYSFFFEFYLEKKMKILFGK